MYALSTTRLRVLTPPVSEPITLSEAKLFLRIDADDDNPLILRAITVAREAVEQYLGLALLPQTLEYKTDYPDGDVIALPRGPLSAVVSVTSTDENAVDTVWAAVNYRASSDGFSLLLKQHPYAAILAIQYSAALADTAAALPALLKQGMLHHIAVLVEARDGSATIPSMSMQCYQPFRRISL